MKIFGLYKIESEKCLVERAKSFFSAQFPGEPRIFSMAPGRVNLIGEHTDYNSGWVLPMALPMATIVVGAPSNGNMSKVVTEDGGADETNYFEFDKESLKCFESGKPRWTNYIKGVLTFHPKRDDIPVFNAVIVSSLPTGSGLSSSAALEVSFFNFVDNLLNIERNGHEELKELALLCQRAEHTFAKVPCGIMDQLVCSMATKSQAVLIDCRSMEIKQIPLSNNEVTLLIINSNVKHELSSSEYPLRKKQCEDACRAMGVQSLRDVTLDQLQENASTMDPICFKRARHVIKENERCQKMAQCLQSQDFVGAGALMNQSHESLKDDYEVSCNELNSLVEAATGVEGVYGSRMTGGGFGGCTVTLLQEGSVDSVIQQVQKQYNGVATFYRCNLNSDNCQ